MTNWISIKKYEGRVMDLYHLPLHWTTGMLDGKLVIWVSCENNHVATLQHIITTDGYISPSLDCEECNWHVWAKLEEWNE